MDASGARTRLSALRAHWPRIGSVALLAGALSGCAGQLPPFARGDDEPLAPRVSHIVQQVQCEVIEVIAQSRDGGRLEALRSVKLAVGVDLTLDVTERGSFNPTLGFIDPRADGASSFSVGIGGQYGREQHRNMHVTFTVIADFASATERLGSCREMRKGSGLRGDLGIAEVIGTGMPFIAEKRLAADDPYLLRPIGVGPSKGAADDPDPPAFGTTVDFELVYGISGGPTWTLTHFVGPGSGLLDTRRTAKDTLVLGFVAFTPKTPAPGVLPQEKADEEDSNRASRAAQGEISRQILRNLNINR